MSLNRRVSYYPAHAMAAPTKQTSVMHPAHA